jgi:hypothetical protein
MSRANLEQLARVVVDLLERTGAEKVHVHAADGTSVELKREEVHRSAGQSVSLLQGFLQALDPDLERKRQGAWQTLEGGTSDRYVQAAHSMREVLRLLLDMLAPTEQVKKTPWYTKPKSGDPVPRAMRVRYALADCSMNFSKSTAELIDSLAKTVDATYTKLCAEAHAQTTGGGRIAAACLRACESVMELIVANREHRLTA